MRQRRTLSVEKQVKEEKPLPKKLTIINSMEYVLDAAEDSLLDDTFWQKCDKPLKYLSRKLGLSKVQCIIITTMMDNGLPMCWKHLAEFFGISRLSMMKYTDEMEDLIEKGWVINKLAYYHGDRWEGFGLSHGVITSLRFNKPFEAEILDNLSEQVFVEKLTQHANCSMHSHDINFEDDEKWFARLVRRNPNLPLCKKINELNLSLHDYVLFLFIVADYAEFAGTQGEGLYLNTIDDTFPNEYETNHMRAHLKNGEHVLFTKGLIEFGCEDGMVCNTRYCLTSSTKTELLSEFKPVIVKNNLNNHNKLLKDHKQIREKQLFFNKKEEEQVNRLHSLLQQNQLKEIQQRLTDVGLRKGFACLFYGGPGTGKTESVLQLARVTGRDIMQVDIASMRDKFVGETEKNMKAIFTKYRALCKESDVTPILFFNEADALIGKRIENTARSVDKMENAMQNILLEELENLDGILIATTNLTSNLDAAFERRFLFKVEFHNPEAEVKAKIWQTLVKGISQEDALALARKYDFSGGQIENIARKKTIEYILTGKEPSFEQLDAFCHNELLGNTQKRTQIIGFRA